MKKFLGETLLFGVAVLLLGGCATLPMQREPSALVEYLPDDGMVYLRLKPSGESEDLWELLLSSAAPYAGTLEGAASEQGESDPGIGEANRLAALMERTDDVYAAIRAREAPLAAAGGLPGLEMAAVGSFPSSAIALGLGKRDEWTKKRVPSFPARTLRTPRVYWSAPELGMEICLLDRHLLFLAAGEVLPMIQRYGSLDRRTRSGSLDGEPSRLRLPAAMLGESVFDIAVYLPDFQRIPFLPGADLPVQDVYVEVRRVEEGYTFPAAFTLNSEDSAKAFGLAFRLFLLLLMKEGEIQGGMKRLGSIEFVQEGLTLRMEGLVLTGEELTSLIAAVRRLDQS